MRWRINLLLILVFLGLLLITARLFQLQILDHEKYLIAAEQQHWGGSEIPAARGKIYSADGFPLVTNEVAYLLYAEPQRIDDPHDVAGKIVDLLMSNVKCQMSNVGVGEDATPSEVRRACLSEIERRLMLDRQWVALAHKIPKEQKEQIEALQIEGIGFEEEPVRFYPEGELAAHVLGFVGSDELGQDQGYYGVEGFYDGDLRGRGGRILQEEDAVGRPILVGGYKKIPAEDGSDLALTINRSLQFIVEKKLFEGVERYEAESGTVIIMEPQTGAILAMANYPTYEPGGWKMEDGGRKLEDGGQETEEEIEEEKVERRNLAIASTYEPGSVIKPLMMSAALDSGTVTPQDTFVDSGPLQVGAYVIDTWDHKHHGVQNMTELLRHSNNVGAAIVGQKMGKEILRDYFLRFGLGEPLGIDLEGEDTGIVKDLSDWRVIDSACAAFGQGISLTPLQMITALSAIANEGKLMKPFVVSAIRNGGETLPFQPEEVSQAISPETASVVKDMLVAATKREETRYFVLKHYDVAGKTGTAQVPIAGHYDPHQTNATFIGFLPSFPKFAMLVKLAKPKVSAYAFRTAEPLWMEIAKELMAYYGIEPDR